MTFGQNERVLVTEQAFKFVQASGDWLVIAICQLRHFYKHTIQSTLGYENLFWRTFYAVFAWKILRGGFLDTLINHHRASNLSPNTHQF